MANTDRAAISDYAKVELVKKPTPKERLGNLITDLKDLIDDLEGIKGEIGQYDNP